MYSNNNNNNNIIIIIRKKQKIKRKIKRIKVKENKAFSAERVRRKRKKEIIFFFLCFSLRFTEIGP